MRKMPLLMSSDHSRHSVSQKDKYYWQEPAALASVAPKDATSGDEFNERLPVGADATEPWHPSRRDFLKLMGFSLAAASFSGCDSSVKKAIPYLIKPDNLDPGIPNYYATTYQSGSTFCGLIVKTREGRPIKVAGNPRDLLSQGGVSPQVEASVLSIYDIARLRAPQKSGATITWDELDDQVSERLSKATDAKAPILLISRSLASPSTKAAIATFAARYPTTRHITYDNPSYSAILDAYKDSFGLRAIPFIDLSKSKCIVSFSADFLGTYLAPTLFSKQFSKGRKLSSKKKSMNRLFVFESNLSLTGANADFRTAIGAGEEVAYLAQLYNILVQKRGGKPISMPQRAPSANLERAAKSLLQAKGASLVLSGQNDYVTQQLCCAINHLLGSYGKTLHLDKPMYFAEGDDKAFSQALAIIHARKAGAVIFYECNPVYEHPQGALLAESLKNTPLTISTSSAPDETTAAVEYIAPTSHYLESWNDAEPIHGQFNLSQPTISPIFRTRQSQSSLLKWSGSSPDYFAFLKDQWHNKRYASSLALTFDHFFDKCLHDGVFDGSSSHTDRFKSTYRSNLADISIPEPAKGLQLVPYFSIAIGSGQEAGNPWLQELPDPITKMCWENALTISPIDARKLGIQTQENDTSLVRLKIGENVLELPALVQPGQAPGTLGLSLGYGRRVSNKVGQNRGADLYALLDYTAGEYLSYRIRRPLSLTRVGTRRVALMQTQNTYMGRQTVIQETTLAQYKRNEGAGRYYPKVATQNGYQKPSSVSLWKGHKYANHHWGMIIDLNSCTGCNACVVACQVENNIPVVGPEEVVRRRDMHWLRIDRYYSSTGIETNAELEQAADNPAVIFQPMLCQHCNNAPCETVCPVAATTHSSEGLNQMTYNRCVGTRYCANNCPYKVRRFNWFKYHDNDQFAVNTAMHNALGKMVLNPDVTVRARGVMEKCSFCVQRIQAGKLTAKLEKRRPKDQDVQTACASACPTEAITFGDLKDPKSNISEQLKLRKDTDEVNVQEKRAYQVLEELNVKPNIWYLTKVRNTT